MKKYLFYFAVLVFLSINCKVYAKSMFGTGNTSADHTKFGPYFGADIQVPLGNTQFVFFSTVEKSIVTTNISSQSVNVGALSYAAGLGYRFR